jgi:hypothetical protein
MAQLSSPGVSVSVIDESFYTPAAPGTVPLIVIATAENKLNSAATGTAPGTLAANAGQVYLMTSQKDLGDTFGTPIFKTDANNNPIHAGEQNEYGLQAAYSLLGVSNRAYVVRADCDLGQLDPTATAPFGDPADGTYWFDVSSTTFGIFEWNATTKKFTNKVPTVIYEATKVVDFGGQDFTPKGSIGAVGDYAVVCLAAALAANGPAQPDSVVWYKSAAGDWVVVGSADWLALSANRTIAIAPHTQVPQWKSSSATTGSVWIKTTTPNVGANYFVKKYSAATGSWTYQYSPMQASASAALNVLDAVGGGLNLATGATYVKYNSAGASPAEASFKIFARNASGVTKLTQVAGFAAGSASLKISESRAGEDALFLSNTITFTATAAAAADAELFASAINAQAGLLNITAEVVSNKVVITHKQGGEIVLSNFAGGMTAGIFGGSGTTVTGSLWTALIVGGTDTIAFIDNMAPTNIPADGRLWYNTIIDEIDIMVHDGSKWSGYKTEFPSTDSAGPIVGATKPILNNSGQALAANDLWIDTSDLENFPRIHKYIDTKWVLVDNSDQTSEDGVLFRDARWTAIGDGAGADASPISELLVSDYVDADCPDPALYPQGMLLWNLRRSGFNVKRFVQNYVDTTGLNLRFDDGTELMTDYYPHRWVSEAANQENGAGTFGHKAQRKVVVQKLQALVNSNQQIRDEESRIFNLMATPGYPELIGEMISLNYDRGLTAFIVGDTPARLTPDATTLSNWGFNTAGALEDNDDGLVSFDEYMGVFYPWGYTSDNIGNNIAVPPSHMMLRTIALSDQVSYPWFAPAGTRRGGITNATAVGYITSEGEFQSVALNTGQRDTLQSVKVNPLTFITGTGLVNYGQLTRARNASALDRINVARLVIYLRRQFAQLAKPYVFEPNDKITRDEIKGAAESLLLELVGQRALYDYIVVCDNSNNTPARIDRNELYLDVAIEPVKAVEFIYIPLRLKNTGEIKALG